MPNTYVACAMSGLPPEEYESFRHVVLDVCEELGSVGRVPYSEPFEVTGDDFDSPKNALRKNLEILDGVDIFILLYTNKESSSALIELGYALKRGVPIIVFAQEGVKRPFYLRESYSNPPHTIRIVPFLTLQELPTLVRQSLQ